MKTSNAQLNSAVTILAAIFGCTAFQNAGAQSAPQGTVFVMPATNARPALALTIASTPYFSYALPQG